MDVRTWSKAPADAEQKPMNCLSWYEAFAFCAWDGGFLPSEVQWHLAATGGAEARKYPWPGANLDPDHALYGACGNGVSSICDETSILEVGSKPAGAGKWGQLDLAGSVAPPTAPARRDGPFPVFVPPSPRRHFAAPSRRPRPADEPRPESPRQARPPPWPCTPRARATTPKPKRDGGQSTWQSSRAATARERNGYPRCTKCCPTHLRDAARPAGS
ncbi:MAG: SUMF1/EgtB/PvdO family nonheme iron enzyme [Myxococcales bacterium]